VTLAGMERENSQSARGPGRLLVCFDFEGSFGMPHDVAYDVGKAASLILERLASYKAHAVFFIVGRIIEEHPDVVQAIAAGGHEIGLHGYEHDDLSSYDSAELAQLDKNLARVGSLVEDLTGSRPECFRAPYLLAPHFYRAEVYAMLKAQGYRWVSNREVRYPVELFRPGLFPIRGGWRRPGGTPWMVHNRFMLVPLNAGMLAKEKFSGSSVERLRWLLGERPPFDRDGLVEVPVYVPLDCDLLGLPRPDSDTPPDALAYTRTVVRTVAAPQGSLTMVTFHDWIVSGGNRLVLLGDALAAARDSGTVISTIAKNPDWLSVAPNHLT
jgi:peptidoglycan/xylan/chitin deacetylase (PgdA/CDA1 family)